MFSTDELEVLPGREKNFGMKGMSWRSKGFKAACSTLAEDVVALAYVEGARPAEVMPLRTVETMRALMCTISADDGQGLASVR